jgi:hypothetical protein
VADVEKIPLHDLPRQSLVDIIANHGLDIAANARLCTGLLLDQGGDCPREIRTLMAVHQAGLPQYILGAPADTALVDLEPFTKYVNERLPLHEEAIAWAVEAWAAALGRIEPTWPDVLEEMPVVVAVTSDRVEDAPEVTWTPFVLLTEEGNLTHLYLEPGVAFPPVEDLAHQAQFAKPESIEFIFSVAPDDFLLFFVDSGRVYQVSVSALLERITDKHTWSIHDILKMLPQERVINLIPLLPTAIGDDLLIVFTAQGRAKRITLKDAFELSQSGLKVIPLSEGDSLRFVHRLQSDSEVLVVSAGAKAKRFQASALRITQARARGDLVLALTDGDEIVGADVIAPSHEEHFLTTITERGYCKRTLLDEFPQQPLGDPEIRAMGKYFSTTGAIIAARVMSEAAHYLLVTTSNGIFSQTPISSIPQQRRLMRGTRVINIGTSDTLAHIVLSTGPDAVTKREFSQPLMIWDAPQIREPEPPRPAPAVQEQRPHVRSRPAPANQPPPAPAPARPQPQPRRRPFYRFLTVLMVIISICIVVLCLALAVDFLTK